MSLGLILGGARDLSQPPECKDWCILYNQWDAPYTMLFIIISTLHVSGSFSAHHQELIKLCVQPWVLSCFPAAHTVL